MFVKQFAEIVKSMADEIQCDGGTSVGSHKVPSRVSVIVDNEEDDSVEYELVSLEPDMLMGCGCWAGIDIHVRKVGG